MSSSDLFMALHTVLLVGFLSVTLTLLVVTVVNRVQVRDVALWWWTGRLFGVPLWPSLFTGLVVLLLGYAIIASQDLVGILAGYAVGGMFWFASALLAQAVLVTEHGIVRNVNRPDEHIPWGRIVDYFERSDGKQARYVFFYCSPGAEVERRRVEITVPASCAERFRMIVASTLDDRFNFSMRQAYGKKALEG